MSGLPFGQHEWEGTYRRDERGRPVPARHHRLLMLDVTATPAADDQRQLERALRTLERRHRYGPQGLLTCLGWGPDWYARHTRLAPPVPGPLPMARWETADMQDIDACLHLASDHPDLLDGALALLAQTLPGCLAPGEVRTGFVGAGLPAAHLPTVPADAPLLMGFFSGLHRNQASEAAITIPHGPLAGGTTMHVSRIDLDLPAWYRQPDQQRVALMYSPAVTASDAGGFVDDAPSDPGQLPDHAAGHGLVGHAQAAARARLDGRPRINRRDFATVDGGHPGTHFVSLQRSMQDFFATRAVMNAADAARHHRGIGPRRRNGINAFLTVRARATFAVPPRASRAFPSLPIS